MRENGSMTRDGAWDLRSTVMAIHTLAISSEEEHLVMASIDGQMGQSMMENGF